MNAADILQAHRDYYHPVVPFDPASDRLVSFDLSKQNKDLTAALYNDTTAFTAYINTRLTDEGARYGIGGYAELRDVYGSSAVFNATDGAEARRLHLGTDIWGRPYTAVMAPLDGLVHSFAFNNRQGDYGATVILTHRLHDLTFYTLYGHLSLSSIKDKQEGQRIEKGQLFAEFGIPQENGNWPPHLHFQIILDTGDWSGDYPGVCAWSQKDQWLANSPDPDMILQLNRYISNK